MVTVWIVSTGRTTHSALSSGSKLISWNTVKDGVLRFDGQSISSTEVSGKGDFSILVERIDIIGLSKAVRERKWRYKDPLYFTARSSLPFLFRLEMQVVTLLFCSPGILNNPSISAKMSSASGNRVTIKRPNGVVMGKPWSIDLTSIQTH